MKALYINNFLYFVATAFDQVCTKIVCVKCLSFQTHLHFDVPFPNLINEGPIVQ